MPRLNKRRVKKAPPLKDSQDNQQVSNSNNRKKIIMKIVRLKIRTLKIQRILRNDL
jgi:hypothetical protein